jgi:hypothetical protein
MRNLLQSTCFALFVIISRQLCPAPSTVHIRSIHARENFVGLDSEGYARTNLKPHCCYFSELLVAVLYMIQSKHGEVITYRIARGSFAFDFAGGS